MVEPWDRATVLALAPDRGSATAAERLARSAPWTDRGCGRQALWGRCQGSGSVPYQTVVDLGPPAAFQCSCPSRKFPCKHALALLLCWADGHVPEVEEVAPFAIGWLTARRERAGTAAPGSDQPPVRPAVADPAAAERRAAARAARVEAGLEELDRWLRDQVRGGIAGLERVGYQHFDTAAARMVDAQAPGVAGLLRAIPAELRGDGWPARVLAQLAALRLLVHAHRRLDALPADLAATVRSRIGYPVAKEAVLASTPVVDEWAALGQVDTVEFQLETRRVWLRGSATGRWALWLTFAAPGQSLDSTISPGHSLVGPLHFYPGSGQYRALPGPQVDRLPSLGPLPAESLSTAAGRYAQLVAADPWADRMPVVLEGTVLVPAGAGSSWRFRDLDGRCRDLVGLAGEPWPLLAQSISGPVRLMAEWRAAGLQPLAVLPDDSGREFGTEVVLR